MFGNKKATVKRMLYLARTNGVIYVHMYRDKHKLARKLARKMHNDGLLYLIEKRYGNGHNCFIYSITSKGSDRLREIS